MLATTGFLLHAMLTVAPQGLDEHSRIGLHEEPPPGAFLPVAEESPFVANRGQWESPAVLVGSVGGLLVCAKPGSIELQAIDPCDRSCVVILELAFEGADPHVQPAGEGPGRASYSFFLGGDSARWRSRVPCFAALRWRTLWPGVDLVLRTEKGDLEYDLECAPGADLRSVQMRWQGQDDLYIEEDGTLVLVTRLGELRQRPPLAFVNLGNDTLRELEATVELAASGGFRLMVSNWTGAEPLRIDPGLVWGSYIGSSTNPHGAGDFATACALANNGDLLIAGRTAGPDFPQTAGSYQHPSPGGYDAFVARFSAQDGVLLFCSVLGGSVQFDGSLALDERPLAIASDPLGQITVAGRTNAIDFPTTQGAFQEQPGQAGHIGFVFRITPMGEQLLWSTFLGSTAWAGFTEIRGLAVSGSGSPIVCGYTAGSDFPVTRGAFKTDFDGSGGMGFVSRLSSNASALDWSTFIGGNDGTEGGAFDLAVDEQEEVIITGLTAADDFPVTGGAWAPPPINFFYGQAYVLRLNEQGSDLVWSSAFGGTDSEVSVRLDLEPDGGVLVGGWTMADDFPTTQGAFQEDSSQVDTNEGFLVRLLPDGSAPVYSTYLISPSYGSRVYDVAVDPSGVATAVGCPGAGFPITPGAFLEQDTDIFLARLDPKGKRLLYSTFFGGVYDGGNSLAVSPTRRVALCGYSYGGWQVTGGAWDTTFNGGQTDGALAVLDLVLQGVVEVGQSIPSCLGPIAAGATEMPTTVTQDFALYASGAPPRTRGFLLLGMPGQLFSHCGLLALQKPLLRQPVWTDSDGWAEVPMSFPPGSQGMTFAGQFVFRNPIGCPGEESCSSSNALWITVQ